MQIPTIETERLRLRAYRPDEFEFYFSMTSDAEVMRYIDKALDRAASFRAFCAMFGHWEVRGHGMWLVENKLTRQPIGHAGLPHWEGSAGMEAGYALHPTAWGHGYATEAVKAVVQYAQQTMGARDVLSVIHPDNLASIRVAERLGAKFLREHQAKDALLRVYVHPNP